MLSPLKFRHKLLFSLTIILGLSITYPGRELYAQSEKYIRVRVVSDVDSVALKISGPYIIQDAHTKKELKRGVDLKTTVTVYQKGILMGNFSFSTDMIMLKVRTSSVILDNRRFNGDIQFIKKDSVHLLAVNYLDLEDYVKGVLYHEASHYWPPEALKAQAIISRTFALFQGQQNSNQDYDVTADIYSQVYGGKTSERFRTNLAVQETNGEILTYQGKIFPTYYHATCAGHTENASELWSTDIEPLKGVVCNFCQDSPHFKWHYVLTRDEIKEALVKSGYKIIGIETMVILDRDQSGRIRMIRLSDGKKNTDLSAKDFRNIIGPNIIRSTNFKISLVNQDVVFEGLGWGHGVGLCQWGAYFMAKQGYTYEQILNYYYPKTIISMIAK